MPHRLAGLDPTTVVKLGLTERVKDAEPNCEIGLTVQKDELIRRIMERCLRQNLTRPVRP